jgi:hypothetical protein
MAYVRIQQSSHRVSRGSEKVFIPNLSIHGFSSEPNTFVWTLGSAYSNFSESHEEGSKFSVSVSSGGLDEKHISIRVEDIKNGEVVFVPVSVTVSNGGESASYSCKITVLKGSPRSTPITIKGIKNGRLIYTKIYQNSIERRIEKARIKNNEWVSSETGGSMQDLQLNIDQFTKGGKKLHEWDLNSSAQGLYNFENEMFNLPYRSRKSITQSAKYGRKLLTNNELEMPMYYDGRSNHSTLFNPVYPPNSKIEEPPFIMPYPEPDECSHETISSDCSTYNCHTNECGDEECNITETSVTESVEDFCSSSDPDYFSIQEQAALQNLKEKKFPSSTDTLKPNSTGEILKKIQCNINKQNEALDRIDEIIARTNKISDHVDAKWPGKSSEKNCPKPARHTDRKYRVTNTYGPREIVVRDESCTGTKELNHDVTVTAKDTLETVRNFKYRTGISKKLDDLPNQDKIDFVETAKPYDSYPNEPFDTRQYAKEMELIQSCVQETSFAKTFQQQTLMTLNSSIKSMTSDKYDCININGNYVNDITIFYNGKPKKFSSLAAANEFLKEKDVTTETHPNNPHPAVETWKTTATNDIIPNIQVPFGNTGLYAFGGYGRGTCNVTTVDLGPAKAYFTESKASSNLTTQGGFGSSNGEGTSENATHRRNGRKQSSKSGSGKSPTNPEPDTHGNTGDAVGGDTNPTVPSSVNNAPDAAAVGDTNGPGNNKSGSTWSSNFVNPPPQVDSNSYTWDYYNVGVGYRNSWRKLKYDVNVYGSWNLDDCPAAGIVKNDLMRAGVQASLEFDEKWFAKFHVERNMINDRTEASALFGIQFEQ